MADRIPLFPLRSLLLPNTDLGLHVYEDRYRSLVEHSLSNGHTFGAVLLRDEGSGATPQTHRVGTLARICGYAGLPDGRYLLEIEGTERFRIERVHGKGEYPTAKVRYLQEAIGHFGVVREAGGEVARLFHLYRARSGDGDLPVQLPTDPVARSYVVAALLRIEPSEKQALLEAATAEDRLRAEQEILEREIAVLDLLQRSRST